MTNGTFLKHKLALPHQHHSFSSLALSLRPILSPWYQPPDITHSLQDYFSPTSLFCLCLFFQTGITALFLNGACACLVYILPCTVVWGSCLSPL